jgi:hypothetical protein
MKAESSCSNGDKTPKPFRRKAESRRKKHQVKVSRIQSPLDGRQS